MSQATLSELLQLSEQHEDHTGTGDPLARNTREARTRPRPPLLAASALAAAASLVAMWPYTAVVTPGMWSLVVVIVVIVAALAGLVGRALFARLNGGIRAVLTLLVQLAAVVIACTMMLAGTTALFGFVPTLSSLRLIELRIGQSVQEITEGVAPVTASAPLATLLGLTFAVVAVLVDQLLAQRLAVLTVLLTSVVGAVPMLLSFSTVNIAWFLLQAVIILMVLRFAARHDRRSPRNASMLVSTSTGLVAVLLTLVIAPVLPVASALPGTGPLLTVDANLRLGDDLRRPEGVQALTLVTSAAAAPYLRIATLSRFDGDVWRPDRSGRVPLREGFGEREWAEPIETVEQVVSIRVSGVSSERLPVPYAAERVTGVSSAWSGVPLNRTVVSRVEDAAGADYTVRTATPAPTLEQIRASSAGGVELPPLSDDLPPILTQLAREVTAGADTDYDRLLALQSWFRDDFTYSLDAPVEEGFDGTGADAVATFLEKREGYCIHFAGAFALMAQTMNMPVRIVVGYLPGTPTDQKRDADIVYAVTSDQLHSWPEVHFSGIGWVPFEPTATLGVPTDFIAATSGGGAESPEAPAPSAAPSTGPSAAPTDRIDPRLDEGAGGDSLQRLNPTPVLLTAMAVLLLVLLPGLSRELQRRSRMARARTGDAMAAWRELTDTMIDLGLPVREAQTARGRADELVAQRGADHAALALLVDAVEHRSYARSEIVAGDLAAPLQVVLDRLTASVDTRSRIASRMLPLSLFRRRSRPDRLAST